MRKNFIFVGLINTIISNLFLQILLFLDFLPIAISTLLFIIINTILGYVLFSKLIFRVKKIINFSYLIRYLLALLLSWLILNSGIKFFHSFNLEANTASIIMIPFLGLYSYLIQKYFVFK